MENNLKILITEPSDFSQRAFNNLSKYGTITIGPFSKDELYNSISSFEVVVVRLAHVFDKQLLKRAKRLKYIITPTTGLNHIDMNEAKLLDIDVVSLKGENIFLNSIPSTAEHTWALLLALVRKIPFAHQHVIENHWNRDKFKGRNLNALKLGIIGYGRVGRQVAKIAQAFDMKFSFYDTDLNKNETNSTDTIQELLRQSDILTIHIPLTNENENFLNQKRLDWMKRGAYIINTSRGELIDENYVVELLEEGKISGIATDVIAGELDTEVRKKSPLIKYAQKHQNVIITPHIAGATFESMHLTEEFVVNKWLELL